MQQHVRSGIAVIENEQVVFAVRRHDGAFEQHVGEFVVERFVFAVLQVITIGEDQAMIVRQHDTRIAYRIQSHRPLQFFVVQDVAEFLFLIRPHFQQNDIADDGVIDFGIIQRLVRVCDGFCVDAFA